MARVCAICGKGATAGRSISHAHNLTPRSIKPNLQRVRAVVDGTVRSIQVCTRCLRSGKVRKASFRSWKPEPAAGPDA